MKCGDAMEVLMVRFRICLAVSALLSFILLVLNFTTKGRCYIEPCEQGSGLADLFTVHWGLSFQGLSSAAALLCHAVYGEVVAARKNNMYRVGLMVGLSIACTLLAAQTTVLWASQVYIMKGMHRHHTFPESGRVSFDSDALEWDFSVLLGASIGLLLSHVSMLCCLYQWRDAQLAREGRAGAPAGEMSPMVVR
eukprot:COSAG06_NODE_433_length_15843_cov_10.266768_18_plen_194_part_00